MLNRLRTEMIAICRSGASECAPAEDAGACAAAARAPCDALASLNATSRSALRFLQEQAPNP